MDEIKIKIVQIVCTFNCNSQIDQNDALQNYRASQLKGSGEIVEIKIK